MNNNMGRIPSDSPAEASVSPQSNDSSPTPDSVEFVDALSSSDSDQEDTDKKAVARKVFMSSNDDVLSIFSLQACLTSALSLKRSPIRGDSWIDLVLTLDGRDKVTKVLQYMARLLAWYYQSSPDRSRRWSALKASLTQSRKAFRLGRTFIEFHRLRKQLLSRPKPSPSASILSTKDHLLTLTDKTSLWIRHLGLGGFWALDNVSFLASTGVWDNWNYHKANQRRQTEQQALQRWSSQWANRSYFASALAGLWMNLRAWHALRQRVVNNNDSSEEDKTTRQAKLQAQYFEVNLALVKSMCDILVFSNNPGVDLWLRLYGYKLHELLHCVCGLTSASVILYKNYPSTT
jgi:hypothetical protein